MPLAKKIGLEISQLPSKLRLAVHFSDNHSFNLKHYPPIYQPPEGVYLLNTGRAKLYSSCRSNEIEDEIHFLFNCPKKYSIPSDKHNKVQFFVHNVKQLPPIETVKELMSSCNHFVNLQLMKFISFCFDLRRKLLTGQCQGEFYHFEQDETSIPLFIYEIILKYQEKEVNQVLKEDQGIVSWF